MAFVQQEGGWRLGLPAPAPNSMPRGWMLWWGRQGSLDSRIAAAPWCGWTSGEDFTVYSASPVSVLAGWSQETHRFSISMSSLFHISHLLLFSALLWNTKAQSIPLQALIPGLEKCFCVLGMLFLTFPHPCPLRWADWWLGVLLGIITTHLSKTCESRDPRRQGTWPQLHAWSAPFRSYKSLWKAMQHVKRTQQKLPSPT